jgi:5-methylcytosine-specific restriction endonuclease McrA
MSEGCLHRVIECASVQRFHHPAGAMRSGNTSGGDRSVRHDATSLRQRVFQRDNGVCTLCGVDTAVLGTALQAEWDRVKQARTSRERQERAEFRRRFRWFFRRRSCWDADHIVPVVEGGQSSLENIRTLCVPCHQRITKELAKRRASHRRQARSGRQGRMALKVLESPA